MALQRITGNLKQPGRNSPLVISLPALKFGEDRGFEDELHHRVTEYFDTAKIPRTATVAVYVKAIAVLLLFITCYVLLLVVARSPVQGVLLSVLLGFALVEIGVNMQHDGSHKAFSGHTWINRVMALTADLIGAGSYFWQWKHNRFHHTFTNIYRFDTDIDLGFLARIAPSARHRWYHKWQHWYIWFFYCFMVIKWQLFDDFLNLLRGRLGNHRIPRPRGGELLVFVAGKAVFLSLAFGIPLLFHPVGKVLFCYVLAMMVAGITLSLIFILPHAVGESEFPVPDKLSGRMEQPRAVHQVRVTVDFMRHNEIVTWLVGGLNFHREHHLFPGVSHAHYKKIYPIVDDVCEKYGIPHVEHKSYFIGLRSHYRWMKTMGKEI